MFHRRKGPYQGAIIDAFVAEVGAANNRLLAAELIGKLGLERPERRMGFCLAALGRDLDRIAATGAAGR